MRQGDLLVRVDRKKDETIQVDPKGSERLKKVLDIRNTVRYNDGIKSNGANVLALDPLVKKIFGNEKSS